MCWSGHLFLEIDHCPLAHSDQPLLRTIKIRDQHHDPGESKNKRKYGDLAARSAHVRGFRVCASQAGTKQVSGVTPAP
jgi:hypothetical protein